MPVRMVSFLPRELCVLAEHKRAHWSLRNGELPPEANDMKANASCRSPLASAQVETYSSALRQQCF